jgi:hypothetical protein
MVFLFEEPTPLIFANPATRTASATTATIAILVDFFTLAIFSPLFFCVVNAEFLF